MITKALVLGKIVGTNKYNVRIPYFESAGGDLAIYEASLCTNPSLREEYAEGDVVFVGFEDHQINKVVILGSLYLSDKDEARGFANLESLNIKTPTNLPDGTKVGGFELTNLASTFETLREKGLVEINPTIPSGVTPKVLTSFFSCGDYFVLPTTDYSQVENTPVDLSQFTNNSENRFLQTSDLDGIATEDWVSEQGFITNVDWEDIENAPTIGSLASKDSLVKQDIPTIDIDQVDGLEEIIEDLSDATDDETITSKIDERIATKIRLDDGVITIDEGQIRPLTQHQDLSGYATETWVNNQGYSTLTLAQVKSDSGINELLTHKDNYLTDTDYVDNGKIKFSKVEHQSLSDYTKTNDLETLMINKGFSKFDGTYNSLSGKPSIPTKLSDLNNDSGFTTFSGNYNDLTNRPTLFSGDYDDLTNKPSIPSISLNQNNKLTVNGQAITLVSNDKADALEAALAELLNSMSSSSSGQQTIANINTRMAQLQSVNVKYKFELQNSQMVMTTLP